MGKHTYLPNTNFKEAKSPFEQFIKNNFKNKQV